MIRDNIKEYLGKMVFIKTDMGSGERPAYYGKVSNYDQDFITINPYAYEVEVSRGTQENTARNVWDKLGKFKAGTTNKKVSIGRRTVLSIEEIVEP